MTVFFKHTQDINCNCYSLKKKKKKKLGPKFWYLYVPIFPDFKPEQ